MQHEGYSKVIDSVQVVAHLCLAHIHLPILGAFTEERDRKVVSTRIARTIHLAFEPIHLLSINFTHSKRLFDSLIKKSTSCSRLSKGLVLGLLLLTSPIGYLDAC
jgi:hypothetical protein